MCSRVGQGVFEGNGLGVSVGCGVSVKGSVGVAEAVSVGDGVNVSVTCMTGVLVDVGATGMVVRLQAREVTSKRREKATVCLMGKLYLLNNILYLNNREMSEDRLFGQEIKIPACSTGIVDRTFST